MVKAFEFFVCLQVHLLISFRLLGALVCFIFMNLTNWLSQMMSGYVIGESRFTHPVKSSAFDDIQPNLQRSAKICKVGCAFIDCQQLVHLAEVNLSWRRRMTFGSVNVIRELLWPNRISLICGWLLDCPVLKPLYWPEGWSGDHEIYFAIYPCSLRVVPAITKMVPMIQAHMVFSMDEKNVIRLKHIHCRNKVHAL